MNAFIGPWYGYRHRYGYEYRSAITIGGWPLLHICGGIDPQTLRLRVARGVIAIGEVAVGVVAIGGLACGLITIGGASLGLLLAVGGAALGFGLSVGALAVGSIAIGAAAIGFRYAIGAVAIAPAALDSVRCDAALLDAARRWLGPVSLPPSCR
jgi:hypothetical protein